MKILIVDDDKKLCQLVADYLEPMGYDVDAAHNGSQGLEMILKGDYEAVILDVMMPGIEDGLKTYQQFREDDGLGRIPIIMVSAIARKTFFHSIRLLKPLSGRQLPEPEAYMEKPPDAAELTRIIQAILQGD